MRSFLEDTPSFSDEDLLMIHCAVRAGYELESREFTKWIQQGKYLPASLITPQTLITGKYSQHTSRISEFMQTNPFYHGLQEVLTGQAPENCFAGTRAKEYEEGKINGEAFAEEFSKKVKLFESLRNQRRRRTLFGEL